MAIEAIRIISFSPKTFADQGESPATFTRRYTSIKGDRRIGK
jgi:hypothetical protein